jgi:ribosomal protein S18 acetylase RimI-like enzyme
MIVLRPMTPIEFDEFKKNSQHDFATVLASTEHIAISECLKNASEQFDRLVPEGLASSDQYFFKALDETLGEPIGYLWLGVQNRFGRKIMSINDIQVSVINRGKGFGKQLMKLVESEAKKVGAVRIRLHVFHSNEIAKKLYLSMGFQVTSLNMIKDL